MLSFKQFLKDYGKKYVALELSEESQEKMRSWCQKTGFDIVHDYQKDIIPASEFEFHTTVYYTNNEVYSKTGIFDIEPIKLKLLHFELLGLDKNVPVFLVDKSPELLNIRKIYENMGMTDNWPDWKPHVSVSYNWTGTPEAKSVKVPPFEITVDRIKVANQKAKK